MTALVSQFPDTGEEDALTEGVRYPSDLLERTTGRQMLDLGGKEAEGEDVGEITHHVGK